jgi:hypothetical protein
LKFINAKYGTKTPAPESINPVFMKNGSVNSGLNIGTIGTPLMSTAGEPQESSSGKVCRRDTCRDASNSRDTNNITIISRDSNSNRNARNSLDAKNAELFTEICKELVRMIKIVKKTKKVKNVIFSPIDLSIAIKI